MTISLHIIARNIEEVKPLVEKYKKYFTEIDVAVDGEPTPVEGANIYKYEWTEDEKKLGFPHFDRKRNFLVDKCKSDWYFRMDTDDEIKGVENIPAVIEKANKTGADLICCYYDYARDGQAHTRVCKTCGHEEHVEGNTHAAHNRETIVRNNKRYYWNKRIHENLIPKDGRPNAIIENGIKIIHHLDMEHAMKSRDRNLRFLYEEYEQTKDNPDPRTLAYLGRMLYPMGKIKEAKWFLEQHIQKSGWDEDKCMSWCMLADIMMDMNNPSQAIACCNEAIRERHDFPDGYLKLHWIYYKLGEWTKAIHWGKIGLGIYLTFLSVIFSNYSLIISPLGGSILNIMLIGLNIFVGAAVINNFMRIPSCQYMKG